LYKNLSTERLSRWRMLVEEYDVEFVHIKGIDNVVAELLSIVETLKEFKDILLGQRIIVHTDHKNLLYKNLSTERLSRWRMLVEEYDVEFVHIKGIDNVVAGGLSRLDADYDSEFVPP
jgi:2,3-bisphosphoglycerate-independent phosphoglycerate mutase